MRILFMVVLSLIVLANAANATALQATPEASPVADGGYANPEMLAEADSLQTELADGSVKVVALTEADEFAAGHIPGAAQIDWPELELVESSDQMVSTWRGEIEQKLTALGLTPDDSVVIYDGGTFYASRLWWILHQLGHQDVRILNGGYPAWLAAEGEVETGPSTVAPAAQPYVGTPDESSLAQLAEVEAALDDPNVALIDARSPKEYADGYIPGAVNIEFTENAEPDQPRYWKSATDIRAMYEEVGATPDKMVIPYCTTGVRSAATYFTLLLLGYEQVQLFSGSWQEWSSHPELPVETAN